MANATIECKFSGRDVSVEIDNQTDSYHDFEYECVWQLENGGEYKLGATRGINAGEKVEVAEGTASDDVIAVYGKMLNY